MNMKTLVSLSAAALGLVPLGLPSRADSAMSGMNTGGTKMSQKPSAAPLTVMATVNPASPQAGDNRLDLLVLDAGGKPALGLKLTTTVAMTSMDMGTTRPPVTEAGGGHYSAKVAFSMNGPWRVVVRNQGTKIAVLDFEAGSKTPWQSPQVKTPQAKTPENTATGGTPAKPPTPAESQMPGLDKGAMPGMDMSGGTAGTDKGNAAPPADQPASSTPDTSTPDMAGMKMTGIADMKTATVPQLQETGTYTATGNENWKQQTGFGRNAPMVGMMNQMMVGGSGAEGMKMAPMKMDFGPANYAKPAADEADTSMPGMDMGGGKTDPIKTDTSPPAAMPGSPAGDAKAMPGMDMAAPTAGSSGPSASTPLTTAPLTTAPLKIAATTASAPKAGDNPLTIRVTDAAGKPVTGAKIAATVTMSSMDMGTAHPAVREKGGGTYAATVSFGMAGPWHVQVQVSVPGQQPQTKAFDFSAK